MTLQPADKLITYQELAEHLGLPIGTLYAWVSEKRIPHIRLGGRLVRFRWTEIDRWLRDRAVEGRGNQVATTKKGAPHG